MADTHAPAPKNDRIEVRLDYVWKWWQFHAKQRTDMFNYFLIINGILANAYVAVLKDNRPVLAGGLAVFGAITAIGFFMLDMRNRDQLIKADDQLKEIEKDERIFNAVELAGIDNGSLIIKHKVVFRGIEVLVGVGWLLVFITALSTWWVLSGSTQTCL